MLNRANQFPQENVLILPLIAEMHTQISFRRLSSNAV